MRGDLSAGGRVSAVSPARGMLEHDKGAATRYVVREIGLVSMMSRRSLARLVVPRGKSRTAQRRKS